MQQVVHYIPESVDKPQFVSPFFVYLDFNINIVNVISI